MAGRDDKLASLRCDLSKVRDRPHAKSLYVGHTLEFRLSAAWLGLPNNARRILDRIEVEHLRHALKENGRLTCTYSDFEAVGIRRASIKRAVRQAEALGFVETVRRGGKTRDGILVPNTYRLTYVKSLGKTAPPPTDEWRRFKTKVEVGAALRDVLREEEDKAERAKNSVSPGCNSTMRKTRAAVNAAA